MRDVTDRLQQLGDDVATRLTQLAETAADAGGDLGEETWQRATDAIDALRGRRSHRFRWLLAGAVVGLAIGYAAANLARADQLKDAARDKARAARDSAARTGDKLTGSADDGPHQEPR